MTERKSDLPPDPLDLLWERWTQSDDPDGALEELCREQPEHAGALRERVRAQAHTVQSDSALASAPVEIQEVDGYRILGMLGSGGMGAVYLAEQREPLRRRVALKLIKLGMDSVAVVRRFEQERQALSLMDHEGIAKVYDVGTSERGQPYFVMELVKGIPLDTYCERKRLSLPDRLELMQQVCAAVQHAHHKGVVHRDLKPSNVLVSDLEGRLQIKIIDFGLAKAMGQKLIEESLFTEIGVVVGTPAFMAPEQADPTNLDIDTRVDVYSLGVMLYQLLVGHLPFSGKELCDGGMAGMQRILREVEPPRPSTKLTTIGDRSSAVAEQLRVSVGTLKKALKGDLDWVVIKALEKDRRRRYQSASALAQDLQRYLDHEPLEAGPPSAAYRLQKLLRRHRAAVTAAALVLLALAGGGVATYVQWRRAELQASVNQKIAEEMTLLAQSESSAKADALRALEARDAALQKEKEALAAEQVRATELEAAAQFLQEQFSAVDADLMGLRLRAELRELVAAQCATRGLDTAATQSSLEAHDERMRGVDFTGLALQSLDENYFLPGLAALDQQFADQPVLQARLRQSVASTLQGLGRLALATEPQQQATAARRRLLGDLHPDTLSSINDLGMLLDAQGKLKEAEPLVREALVGKRRVLGDDHFATLRSAGNLGLILQAQGRLSEAEPLLREVLASKRRLWGAEHPGTLRALDAFAGLLQAQGKLAEAEPLVREALAGLRRALGDEHPFTIASEQNLAGLLQAQGNFEEAAELVRVTLTVRRRTLGAEHPGTLGAINRLAQLMQSQGKLSDAEPLQREAVDSLRRVLGDEHPTTLTSINNLGLLLKRRGRLEESEQLVREALSGQRRVLGAEHPDTLMSINNLALLLQSQGEWSEATSLIRESVAGKQKTLGEKHPSTLASLSNLGLLLQAQGELAAAEPMFREALAGKRSVLGSQHPDTLKSIANLGTLLAAQGERVEAERLVREALAGMRLALGAEHPDTLRVASELAALLAKSGALEEAEQLVRETLTGSRRALGDVHPSTLNLVRNLGTLLYRRGDMAAAAPLFREALVGRRRTLGDGHPSTGKSVNALFVCLVQLDRREEARAFLAEFLATTELASDHANVVMVKKRIEALERQ